MATWQPIKQTSVTCVRPSKPVVICLGDSHTRGVLGGSWYNILTERHKHLQFVNAGVDGETSERIKLRLQPLLQQFPDPVAVILFAGSNDNISMDSTQMQWYYKLRHGAQPCSFPFYEANMRLMLDMVQQQAPSSKMHSKVWQQAAGDDCSQAQTERMHKFSLISGGWLMGTAVLQRYWLHRAWDDISRARGLHLLTDQVHLNDTAAALLAAQLEPLMQRLGKQEQL